MTSSSQRRTSGGGRARTSRTEDSAAADAPGEATADAPEAEADAPEAPADAPAEATPPEAPAEGSSLVDRAKARLGIGGDGDDGDEAATDGPAPPEEPSWDGEETCVHPSCQDPTIPAGEEYFMSTAGPAQGPMHHSCSHKTIPISR